MLKQRRVPLLYNNKKAYINITKNTKVFLVRI